MQTLSFEHLTGARGGETDEVAELPIALGSDPRCAVQVPEAAAHHALVLRQGDLLLLRDGASGRGTSLAGQPVREALLRDGDVIELGDGGPRLRLRFSGPEVQVHAPRRPLLTRANAARAGVALGLLAALGAIGYEWRRLDRQVGVLEQALRASNAERERLALRVEQERERADADRLSLEARLDSSRQGEEELRQRLAAATGSEVQGLRTELEVARQRLASLEQERAAGERIIRDYGAGVCLIQGAFAWFDASGRPLRYRLEASGQPAQAEDGGLALQVEGDGPIHSEGYFGTGFLVDARGLVLTNRHVAEPWTGSDSAAALAERGFSPRLLSFRAFFPQVGEPFPLKLERRSEAADLALLRTELAGRRLPVLPLDRGGRGAVPGQPVVVVGYPTGLEAILAKADATVVREILGAYGANAERITEAFARKGLIRPSTTQGHIGDITRTDIVFDAPTTHGGSGGPVFNKHGKVIAIEYAVLSQFGGNSFGLPVRFALELLRGPRP